MISDESIIESILRREGSEYTNLPSDRGGPTRYGITMATLAAYRRAPVNAADVEELTEAEARDIYYRVYIDPFHDVADGALKALLVDSAVQHGVGTAVQWLQRALGTKVDGAIGPKTKAAIQDIRDAERIYADVLRTRLRFYGQILRNDPSQCPFAEGWINRVAEFITG